MSDHLDYIRIRGLSGGKAEVFQGAAGADGGGSTVTSGGGSETQQEDWTAIPQEAVDELQQYTTDVNAWLDQVKAQSRALAGSRGGREITALVPYVPNVVSTLAAGGAIVATGGAALPAVATVMATQAVMNLVTPAIQNYAASLDENSPQNLLKKAFLYEKDGEQHSILGQAFLTPENESALKALQDILDQRLSDLAYVDETIDFGFCRVHIKGKMIEY
jgi:hypothetical protein